MPKKYTSGQRKAYYSGMGYAVRGQNRNIRFTSEDVKESFLAGYKVGKKIAVDNAKKYPFRKK